MATELSGLGRQSTAISNAITRLHREHYGRGATVARTVMQRNYITCFLEDIYTPVEKTLIENDGQEAVKTTRQLFQQAMRPAFVAAVEEITGRTVVQFMSQVAFDPDMAAEIFVLQSVEGELQSADGDEPAT
jgi:uncharacterized protein YbcI